MNNDINKSSILAPLPMGEGLGERLRADFPIGECQCASRSALPVAAGYRAARGLA